MFLIIVSYIFYGWWDWRFLILIIISSATDFILGIQLFKSKLKRKRKLFLIISIVVNIGLLSYFKYSNFFIESFISAFESINVKLNINTLKVILPVGISFYTFQTLSYTIDIYNNKLKPTKNVLAFFAYVSFFPQLVAGPIERARNLLPQFLTNKRIGINQVKNGFRLMLWGLFKKTVIADNCSIYVDQVFSKTVEFSSLSLFLGIILFAFQIYCDFSGYSDIAIGVAKLFNFELMTNFNLPYFSRNIGEFWRRWHISLSTWFRDYVYIPLGGNRGNKIKRIRNSLITFTVSGFWHGANWTFIVWGVLNGLYYIPSIIWGKKKAKHVVAHESVLPSFREFIQVIFIFSLISITWIFFRAQDLSHAFEYLTRIFSFTSGRQLFTNYIFVWIGILLLIEWIQRKNSFTLDISRIHVFFRWSIYLLLIIAIVLKGQFDNKEFIYFQF